MQIEERFLNGTLKLKYLAIPKMFPWTMKNIY